MADEVRTINTLIPRAAVEDRALDIIEITKARHRAELGDDGECHHDVLTLTTEREDESSVEPWRVGVGMPGDVLVRSTLTRRQ